MKYLRFFLIFIPISILLHLLDGNEGLVFFTACLSVVPLSAVISNATEQLSLYTGSKIGGLLNATMGNIPELLIGLFAVRAGYFNLVLASMAGSIIGNMLLVLGFSALLGGFKHQFQYFNKNTARSNFTLLFFAALSVIIPFTLKHALDTKMDANTALASVSFSIAVAMLVIYISGLIFSLITHRNVFIKQKEENLPSEKPRWKLWVSVTLLAVTAFFIALESEMIVDGIDHVIANYGLSEVFIGIILIPLIGNVAEHASAIIMAIKNKVDICVEIAVGSSIQIALFVAPLLILVSFFSGKPIIYVYDLFMVVAMLSAIGLSLYIFSDGKTNWLEGLVLISCYSVLGVAFFFL